MRPRGFIISNNTVVRSYKISKRLDLGLALSDLPEIWQAYWQHCCRGAYQTSKRHDNLHPQSRFCKTPRYHVLSDIETEAILQLFATLIDNTLPITPSQFPPFRYFSASPTYMLATEYHVHIGHMSPQLGCGDTCPIWMWCKKSNGYFCRIQNFTGGEINEGGLSNPHSRYHIQLQTIVENTPVQTKSGFQFEQEYDISVLVAQLDYRQQNWNRYAPCTRQTHISRDSTWVSPMPVICKTDLPPTMEQTSNIIHIKSHTLILHVPSGCHIIHEEHVFFVRIFTSCISSTLAGSGGWGVTKIELARFVCPNWVRGGYCIVRDQITRKS